MSVTAAGPWGHGGALALHVCRAIHGIRRAKALEMRRRQAQKEARGARSQAKRDGRPRRVVQKLGQGAE